MSDRAMSNYHRNTDFDHFVYTYLKKPSKCYLCNGYYGPCLDEHICKTCHLFLFSGNLRSGITEEMENIVEVKIGSKRNNEPQCIFYNRFEQRDQDNLSDQVHSQELTSRLQLLSGTMCQPFDSNNYIQQLPPEVLIMIFSYLDDLSLWCISKVCMGWNQLVLSYVPQTTWCRLVYMCWPMFKPLRDIDDWHFAYSSLIYSSSCLPCIIQMFNRSHAVQQKNPRRRRRLQHEIISLNGNLPQGVSTVFLDRHWCHWQAKIFGPTESPFAGGIFYLHIIIPFGYPIKPPVVRFLTKIFHPNVSRHGDIGLDSIQHNWSLALTVAKVLVSIQSMLTDPFCDVCMEPDIARLYMNDRQTYDAVARYWTRRFAMHDKLTSPDDRIN